MDMQKHLLYLANLIVSENLETNRLRAVEAKWQDGNPILINYYFDGPISDEDKEMVWDMSGGIMSNFDGLLEENYIRLDYPKPLPESPYWAYKRDEKPNT